MKINLDYSIQKDIDFIKEAEKMFKSIVFTGIGKLDPTEFELISELKKKLIDMGQSGVNIPVTTTTLHNRLNELSHEFNKSGLS